MSDAPSDISEALLAEICQAVGDLAPADARRWIARGWIDVRLLTQAGTSRQAVVRRLVLIQEMRRTLGVGEESLDVVLDLVERLRVETRKLACLNAAIDAAPGVDAARVRQDAARMFRERLEAEE
mgnify:CR=1 FL=1